MDISRRGFLKFTAAAITAGALEQVLPLKFDSGFDILSEYSRAIRVECRRDVINELQAITKLIEFLKKDATKFLPTGTKYEILEGCPIDFGRTRELAWIYSPANINDEWIDLEVKTFDIRRGLYMWHRLIVGNSYEA